MLEPKPAGSEQQGSDVAMLEELLWQLGLSPQKGKKAKGSLGARIASNRNDAASGIITTTNCQNTLADKRSVFYSGKMATCTNEQVSLELMIARFQARNTSTKALVFDRNINAQNAVVDNNTLTNLKRDSMLYTKAYDEYPQAIIQRTDAEFAQWITDAVDIWSNGSTASVPLSYTDAVHNSVLQDAGLTNAAFTRNALLTAWISEESPYHWGLNRSKKQPNNTRVAYQRTDYRILEGNADEHGSLSFSQLLYGKRFGPSACKVHIDTNLNPYNPAEQVKMFVVHTAAASTTGVNCPGGMNQAFVKNTLGKPYEIAKNIDGDISDLVGIKGKTPPLITSEDNYETLAKAIFYYNSNKWVTRLSWPYMMKYLTYKSDSGGNKEAATNDKRGTCHSCRYSIQVREKVFPELRTYIWAGARDATGTVLWCFAFGEKDWVGGKKFDNVRKAARGDPLAKPPVPAKGRVNCTTGP